MVETKLLYNPDIAIHPGETLRDELEFLNLTQVELSNRTGLSEKHISQIINGVEPITSETALKLERAIGTPATFWNNLQKNYDLNAARINSVKKIYKEVVEAKKFKCYSDLVELGFVEDSKNWNIKTENLLKFFGVNSLSYIQKTESVAFRQAKGKFDARSLAAWLRCGELEANKMEVQEFDKNEVQKLIPQIKKLTLHPKEFGNKLRELCLAAGIAVVYTPYFKNTRVNGSARWIGNKAVIQLNTKGAYSDVFWFTFFHELGHILLHGVKEKFIDYANKIRDQKEKEADKLAAETLIPSTEYKKLIENQPLQLRMINDFAESNGIGMSIVLGRLAHEGVVNWKTIARLRSRLEIK